MKLFNDKWYLISLIKHNEKDEVVNIAKNNKLGIKFPNLFYKGTNDLSRICIDDERLGGYLSGMICCYEISILKNKDIRVLKNVKELKEYIDKAKQRKELYIIKENDVNKYSSYVKNLSNNDLRNEYIVVKNLIELIDSFYTKTKDYIDTMIINSIEYDIQNNNVNLDLIYEELNRIVELRNRVEDFLNIDIYITNNGYEESDKTNEEMISYLIEKHTHFHTNYGLLKTIFNNLDNIFNTFNYKLKAEGKVSYGHKVFNNLRSMGFEKLPDDIIGDKDDYVSVLNKLLYFLTSKVHNLLK